MSIMKGKLRRSAVVVAFAVGAFQALSIVGAQVASAAAVSCTFSGGALTVQLTGAGDVFSRDAAGNILVNGAQTSGLGAWHAMPRSTRPSPTPRRSTSTAPQVPLLTDDDVTIQTYISRRQAPRRTSAASTGP